MVKRVKAVFPITLALVIFTVLISCNNQDSNSFLMKRAERSMASDPYLAMNIIDSIPDSILNSQTITGSHNGNCLTVARFNKSAKDIQDNQWEEAKNWLRLIIVRSNDEQEKKRALDILEKTITLSTLPEPTDSLKEMLIAKLIASDSTIQHHSEEDLLSSRKSILKKPMYWITVIILLIVISLLLFNQHKQNKDKTIKSYRKEITQLTKQAKRINEGTSERLGIGKQIYDSIMNGGQMKNISIEHEQCFIDYYAFSFPQEYAALTSPYASLSLRHTTYLILKHMGFSDSDIKDILFVKAGTLRSYRLRIEKNRKA